MSLDKCFDNFIGVKGCNNLNEPTSCLYIEDLAGLHSLLFENIAGSKFCNGDQLAKRSINMAIQLVMADFKAMLSDSDSNLTFNKVPKIWKSKCIRKDCEEQFLDTNPENDGIKIWFTHKTMLSIFLKGVWVHIEEVGDFVLTIKGCSGILDEIPFTSNGCKQWLDIGKYYDEEWIEILMPENITPSNFYLHDRYIKTCGCNKRCVCHKNEIETTRPDFYTNGICPEIEIRCALNKFFCSIKEDLKFPILYKAGILILEELQSSDRLNEFTIYNDSWVQSRILDVESDGRKQKGSWVVKYEKYMNSFKSSINNYLLMLDSNCFECKGWNYGYTTN